MHTKLVAYANSDDALLRWTCDALDDRVEGFAIQRRLRRGSAAEETAWLDNFAAPGPKPYQNGVHYPSNERPFRAYAWTDHSVSPGDRVRYRVIPFLLGATAPETRLATRWSRTLVVGTSPRAHFQAFFNRGFVISQFVSRYLDETYPGLDRIAALRRFKQDITDELDNRIRLFLSGQVRTNLLELLDGVAAGRGRLYAAMFELGDEEIVRRLVTLGSRVHLVLANGSVSKRTGETSADARKRDENADARKALRDAGVDVGETDRFVSPSSLAHNKFAVVVDSHGRPGRVWTGSTNWTTTGLCTQLNNALLVEDRKVAEAYLDQWHKLRDAGSSHPRALTTANGAATEIAAARGRVSTSIRFTRAPQRADLEALREIVNAAQQGVLFLMFIPGSAGVLGDVQALAAARPDLLVRGVVSELPQGRQDEQSGGTATVRVTVVGGGTPGVDGSRTFDVVQPEGNANATANWAAEVTHQQFVSNIGYAIIHSKVLVVDPFGDHPVVVTGSHNFSVSASTENDENLIVVRDDPALAAAYAVNVDSAWRHYANRAGNPFPDLHGLAYLQALLDAQRREETFWGLA